MSYNSRRILTPGVSRKRKEADALYSSTFVKPLVPQTAVTRAVSGGTSFTTSFTRGAELQPLSSNRLLAGYLAHEFLTKGTLLGQKFDPARAEAAPVIPADPKRNRLSHSQPSAESEPSGKPKPKPKPQSYADVANLLKTDGAHIPGVVNPTQLARWIQM